MDAQKTPLLLAALTFAALFCGRPADAGTRLESKPATLSVKMLAPIPAVIVRLDDAMLEEYRAGDPSRRTVILREGDSATQACGQPAGKKLHS